MSATFNVKLWRSRKQRSVAESNDALWELVGYVLWLIGSALFAVVAYRNDDTLSLVGSVLFFVGIMAVMVPMTRRFTENRVPGNKSTQ